ncbi:NERD domain-containing protein [Aquabacterium sp.]|uniref:NERD domain-containing protein n=1 Tax=Aquabacterium sp. TaxID=1872578 RepID=UPI0035ADD173
MIIKTTDDKTKRLALLAELKQSPLLDAAQRKWLEDELVRVRRGIEGERDAAFYIDSYLKDSKNNAVLHDLRLSVDGDTAQIDHLFFNRFLDFFLIETKCFNANIDINEHGEFSLAYASGKRFGIESPIEQSRRHERILAKVLDRLEITGRMGKKPNFHHVVLLHPKAVIRRPRESAFDTSMVIKADALPSWHKKWIDQDVGVTDVFAGLLSVRSADTVKEWGDKLARQHRPANLLALPEFMQPKAAPVVAKEPEPRYEAKPEPVPPAPTTSAPDESLKKKLICVTCGEKITFAEGRFCWGNERRFGGFQYCREHQKAF